ncbi:MAG: hypothetical protein H6999_12465 [Hahellaceae bacterium]|nr:hypothetical protein [Hahellaceae bacterium]MCP5170556.1 hypothetical protein [Hahellaceae bacterium]
MYNNNTIAEYFMDTAAEFEMNFGAVMDKKAREKISVKRRMAARRAIEAHYENKQLEKVLSEFDLLS